MLDFEFKTTKDVEITIQALDAANQAMAGVYMSVYSANPLNEDGSLKDNASDFINAQRSNNS
jgi:hypothetical protein